MWCKNVDRGTKVSSLKLSIVVCSYNQGTFIRETLDSLINQQSVTPEELEARLRSSKHTNTGWAISSEPDRGQTHALNKGLARATGDVLGWLCSDDLLQPGIVTVSITAGATRGY